MHQVPRRILVPTDFSSIAANAQGFAIALARALRAELHILHVQLLIADPHLDTEHQDRIEQLLASANPDRVQALQPGAASSDLSLETHLVRAVSEAEAIVATAEELACDLIIMGTHGRRGLKHLVLGSVAEEVVRSSPAPVMTVRPEVATDDNPSFDRILVPHDFSEHSMAALDLAAAWARRLDASLLLLHVVEPIIQPELYAVDLMPLSLTHELRDRSLAALRELADRLHGLDVACEVASGRPSDHIIDHAEATDANLIVMGTRGLSAITEVLLGSVTEGVLRRCTVPLLTVRSQ